jgi:predicted membrane chloride channel (bestrophin family)
MKKAEVPQEVSPEVARAAALKAKERARVARWDLNIAIFLFAVLILVIILSAYTKAGLEVVAPTAVFGLAMVWLVGWRREQQLYHRFYEEEVASAQEETKKTMKEAVKETIEETIEAQVQKALRERWQR